ncbi:MAG: hypothetical protein R6V76_14405 [Desulfobacterales bacterium]
MMAMFISIQGFEYTIERYATLEEAMKTIDMTKSGQDHLIGLGIKGRDQARALPFSLTLISIIITFHT